MNFTGNNNDKSPQINIVPMIDVVLQLVIFFMLTTTFVSRPGIQVKLPKAASEGIKSHKRLEVAITSEGQVYFENTQMDLKVLKVMLEEKAKGPEEYVLVINADEMARHGIVVKVMDIARKAGLEDMAIATEKESNEKT